MTDTLIRINSNRAAHPRIMNRALAVRLISIVASSIGFFLPLSAVPLFAEAHAPGSAGAASGSLLVACVVGELATPWVISRLGVRRTLGLGLVLLGAPMLILLAMPTVPAMIAVGIARGIGFALAVVAGGALTAALIPAERRGEGLAIVGLVAGISSFVALPFGVWAAQQWGFAVVFIAAAAIPVLGVATMPWLQRRAVVGAAESGLLSGLRSGALMRPAIIFLVSAAAAGVVITYLPLALTESPAWLAPAALLVQAVASTGGRWMSGRIGDRRGASRLIAPGILLVGAGVGVVALGAGPVVVLAGATAFGLGFGVLQNATLSLMYARADVEQYGVVSAIWNGAYDGGMAVGAIGVGLVSSSVGFAPAFGIIAAVVVATLAIALIDRAKPNNKEH